MRVQNRLYMRSEWPVIEAISATVAPAMRLSQLPLSRHGGGTPMAFGWLATIAAGIVAYVFWKIAIAVAIGRYQGAMLRSQIDAVADVLANKQRPNESADDFKK
jgi:hypothetical protein